MEPTATQTSPTRVSVARPPQDDAALAALRESLDDAECTAAARFLRAVDRAAYATAHALLRTELSAWAAGHGAMVEPPAWRFERNAFGKPAVMAPVASLPPLQLSLSHSHGLVAVALREGAPVGVDVEAVTRIVHDAALLARDCFTARERRWLDEAGQPGDAGHAERFFALWTAKEAYIKGLGEGLSHPLQDFSADIANHAYLRGPGAARVAGGWRLRQWRVDGHLVALAEATPWQAEPLLHDGLNAPGQVALPGAAATAGGLPAPR